MQSKRTTLFIILICFFISYSMPLFGEEYNHYAARGFDTDGDGQVDYVNTGDTRILGVEIPPANSGIYLQSELGGMTAPMAYYHNVDNEFTTLGLDIIKGEGTFARPQLGSALQYRTILFSTSGSNALKAFYTDAISSFTPQLLRILEAEEYFRTAIQANPYNQDALNGLMECYYARAEGFMMIGNDYIAKAYRHKFERDPNETQSIVELEIEELENALMTYEIGFREFMKLFNPEFTGLGNTLNPHLAINAEYLFFKRRFQNPNNPYGELVAYESMRGQDHAIGISTKAFDGSSAQIGPVQGSLNYEGTINTLSMATMSSESLTATEGSLSVTAALDEQWNLVDAPVKFQLPIVEGSPTFEPSSVFWLHYRLDAREAVKTVEVVIEFDHEKLEVPVSVDDITAGDDFSNIVGFYPPNSVYNDKELLANQILIVLETESAVSGNDLSVVKVPFRIKLDQTGEFYVYVAGSGEPFLNGYKDIGLLYRLGAAHANTTAELVKRLYKKDDADNIQQCIDLIQEETDRIGSWFEHIQALLSKSATADEISGIDQLQSAINQVSAEISGLSALREFIRSGANEFGYPEEWVPFYNSGNTDTFTAIKNIVVGTGTTPQTYGGHFGTAREAETDAVQSYEEFENTKDKIRNELFTINEQAESRLVQICGRVGMDENNNYVPSLNVNDPIDYDMKVSSINLTCEIGQHTKLLERAYLSLDQANVDILALDQNIKNKQTAVASAVDLRQQEIGIIAEYAEFQTKITEEIYDINARQTRLNAAAQAAQALLSASNGWDFITGKSFDAPAIAGIILANGEEQARLEEKKGDLQALSQSLSAQERIKLLEIDSIMYTIEAAVDIEAMINQMDYKQITAEIAEVDVQIALGNLHRLILERDEVLARRGRTIANLGEMSFADPSFRLHQFKAMKDAEIHLEFLKKWLYLMTRVLYYKCAKPDNEDIALSGYPTININDINRIQIVGTLSENSSETPLEDNLTAADYVRTLLAYNDAWSMYNIVSPIEEMTAANSNYSARYSLREDFLGLVRTENTSEETERVRQAFRNWIQSPDRLDEDGNLVIEFDTLTHYEHYDEIGFDWMDFALRSYHPTLPLWNHKITRIGVAIKSLGNTFISGSSVQGAIEYGGAGMLKQDSDLLDDYLVYSMRQWRYNASGLGMEPVDMRSVGLSIPTSGTLEQNESVYMSYNLMERPVAGTLWRLLISSQNYANINLDTIEDIYIYIYSEAYLRQ